MPRENEESNKGRKDRSKREENRECRDQVLFSFWHVLKKECTIRRHGTLYKAVRVNESTTVDDDELTPTALPRKNKSTQRLKKELANDARMPNRAVKKSVALNAALRPTMSEQVPHPIAPIIIPANMDDESVPI